MTSGLRLVTISFARPSMRRMLSERNAGRRRVLSFEGKVLTATRGVKELAERLYNEVTLRAGDRS